MTTPLVLLPTPCQCHVEEPEKGATRQFGHGEVGTGSGIEGATNASGASCAIAEGASSSTAHSIPMAASHRAIRPSHDRLTFVRPQATNAGCCQYEPCLSRPPYCRSSWVESTGQESSLQRARFQAAVLSLWINSWKHSCTSRRGALRRQRSLLCAAMCRANGR